MNELMKGIVETIEAVKTTAPAAEAPKARPPKIGRNEKCPCESGKKYKKCCGGAVVAEPEFKFMDARDKVGLPMEHAAYVKRNCTDCNGAGYIRLLIGDAREVTPRTCFCVNKGYVRTRKEFERQWALLLKDEKFAPHSEAEEWAARTALVIKMGFTAPPIPEKAEPAPMDV